MYIELCVGGCTWGQSVNWINWIKWCAIWTCWLPPYSQELFVWNYAWKKISNFSAVVDYVCEAAALSHLLLERQVGFWKKMIAPKTLQNSCCHVCRPWSSWDTMQNITHGWTRFCEGNCFVCECLFSTLIDCRRFGEADASWARGVGIAFTTWN